MESRLNYDWITRSLDRRNYHVSNRGVTFARTCYNLMQQPTGRCCSPVRDEGRNFTWMVGDCGLFGEMHLLRFDVASR